MDYAAIVDELGALKARIADLTKQETKLKTALIESGYAEIDGSLFRAAVTWTERATLDSEAVRALQGHRFQLEITGSGWVKAQNPEPGRMIRDGSTVRLQLAD
jgi:hypothetical protein